MLTLTTITLIMVFPLAGQKDIPRETIREEKLFLESLNAGKVYASTFRTPGNAALFSEIGTLYMDQSKPIQAILYYEKALRLDALHADAVDGQKKAEARLEKLLDRIKYLEDKDREKPFYRNHCSKAAILFHLGKLEASMKVMDQAAQKFGSNPELRGLKTTFRRGMMLDALVMKEVDQLFDEALEGKRLDDALTHIGQLVFISRGVFSTKPHIERLAEVFPEESKKLDFQTSIKILPQPSGP